MTIGLEEPFPLTAHAPLSKLAPAISGAGRSRRHSALAGAGTSLLLHGAMLLLFDTGLFLRNAHHHQRTLQSTASELKPAHPPEGLSNPGTSAR